VRDQVSHPYKTTGRIMVLYTEVRGKILCLCQGSNPGSTVCSQTLYWLRSNKGGKEKLGGGGGEANRAPMSVSEGEVLHRRCIYWPEREISVN
jgi:hypothetical protein